MPRRPIPPRLEALEDRNLFAVGLVAAYAFNEGTGLSVADASGNGTTGTISGAAWTTAGKYGNALTFNGTSNWVTVPDSASLDVTSGLTLEAWVRPSTIAGWRTVFTKETGGGEVYQLYASNGATPVAYLSTTTGGDQGFGAGAALPLNTWTHLAATYDGSALHIYVNGNLAGTQSVSGAILTSTSALRIGGNGPWGEYFSGQLDELRVYNRALTATEIGQDENTAITTSADTTPPTVTAVSPASAATKVIATTGVKATFSEAIAPATISASTFTLTDPSGSSVAATVSYDAASLTATLTPGAALAAGVSYTARVKGGTGGVTDVAGNALASDFVWTFTTAAAGGFVQTDAITGLTNPTVVRFAPDGRVFVAEKRGVIKEYSSLSAATPTVFADLNVNVFNAWDRGLLGMALPPDFATNPYVYVLYTLDANSAHNAPVWGTPGVYDDPLPTPPGPTNNGVVVTGRLSRFKVNADGSAGAEEILIDKQWQQQFPSHSIGTLQFGPDGNLYASAGDGASFNYVDYGQTPVNVNPRNPATMGDPANEGGALRAQDLLSSGDPVTLEGSIIRVSPATGAAAAGNPLLSNPDPNAQRIIAEGLRNPYRFVFRPGTSEVWVGDVGWDSWEEINRLVSPTASTVTNFGWPAYEGAGAQPSYQAAGLPLLQPLYTNPALVTAPYYTYAHSAQVVAGDGEPTGGSATTGLAFYTGGSYPSQYNGALFFADYSRNWIWAMLPGANGLPDPNNRVSFVANAAAPVNLEIGPNGDLFYVGFNDGIIHRIQYVSGNRPPVAAAQASPTSGAPPLTVQFDGSGSSDPDPGTTLSYSWDLNGDGAYGDSTAVKPTWTYSAAGTYVASLRVTDNGGLSGFASVTIHVGNTAPTAVIDAPLSTLTYQVGQTITFSGHASDPEQGTLPASALTWSVIIHHADHTHQYQTFTGVAGGSFVAPDHEYPSYLEVVLTATDSGGLSSTASVSIQPRTVSLTVAANYAGLNVGLNSETLPAPFTRTVILGSTDSLLAPTPQTRADGTYVFSSWSDGGAATHTVTAGATATYTATYVFQPVTIGSEGYGYVAQTAPFEPIDLVAGAAGVFTVRASGGNQSNKVTLAGGLTFNSYGTSYTQLYVSTNGLITFGSGNTSATNTDLTSAPTQRAIAVLWDDWVSTSGNTMILGKYEDKNGDGISDRLILEWNNVQGAPTSPSPVTFQAILYLNTGTAPGDVVFNYPDLDAGDTRSNGGSATVGIKDSGTQGTHRLLVSFNSATSPYVGSGKAIRFHFGTAGAAALPANATLTTALMSTTTTTVSSPSAPTNQATAAPTATTPTTQLYVAAPAPVQTSATGTKDTKTASVLFVAAPALPDDEKLVSPLK
jgi:glucose/arabinose dehydrogenase